MTIHWGRPVSGRIIFGLMLLIYLCMVFHPLGTKSNSSFLSESVIGNTNEPEINDSLPHYQYTRIKDSLMKARSAEDYFYNASGTSGIMSGNFGFTDYEFENKQEHFLIVDGYETENFTKFENKKTGTVVQYPVWDRVEKHQRRGHYVMMKTALKFMTGEEPGKVKVYVPLGREMSIVLKVIFYTLLLVVVLAVFYAMLFIPVRFLYHLSKGNAFTEENIGNLYLTGWTLVFISLLAGLLPVLAHLLIRPKLPPGFHFSYYDAIFNHWGMCLVGLGVILLAKAFLQGLDLQEDQDLTI